EQRRARPPPRPRREALLRGQRARPVGQVLRTQQLAPDRARQQLVVAWTTARKSQKIGYRKPAQNRSHGLLFVESASGRPHVPDSAGHCRGGTAAWTRSPWPR